MFLVAANVAAQPVATKSFMPNPITAGQTGTIVLTLSNPSAATTLNGVGVIDPIPGCINVALFSSVGWVPTNCNITYGGNAGVGINVLVDDTLSMRDFTLPPGAFCAAIFDVFPTSFPCYNQTNAPYSAQGAGLPASATWNDTVPSVAVFTEAADTGDMGNDANWSIALEDDFNLYLPDNLTIKDITNGITGMTFNVLELDCSGCGLSGNAVDVAGFVVNVSGTVSTSLPWTLSKDASFQATAGAASVTGDINLNGHNLGFFGPASVFLGGTMGGVVSGAGTLTINGPFVSLGAAPTFTGTVELLRGELENGVTLTEDVNVRGQAILSGPSESYHAIIDWDNGVLEPGSGTTSGGTSPTVSATTDALLQPTATPATWSTGPLTINDGTEVLINFGTNNTQYSKITSNAALTINGGVLKLNFVTAPSLGVTYGAFISTTGTRTGCPTEVVVCNPASIEAVPVCFLGSVDAKIVAVDSIKRAGFDEFYEGCP
jgi:hypothetical protein